jgi:hypothetical protein
MSDPLQPSGIALYANGNPDLLAAVRAGYTGLAFDQAGNPLVRRGAVNEYLLREAFEAVAKNMRSLPSVSNYTGDNLTSVVYTLPDASTITKTLNYTGDNLTSIVLSGAIPTGIPTTKTLTYTGDNLTGVSYA